MPKKFPLSSAGFNPFCDRMGLNFTSFGEGRSSCTLEVHEDLFNPHRVLHGGVIYTMADTGMGGALYSELNEDELCATLEIKIVYFEAVREGLLSCDTRLLHKSRKTAFLESDISRNGRPVAKALGTYQIFKSRTVP